MAETICASFSADREGGAERSEPRVPRRHRIRAGGGSALNAGAPSLSPECLHFIFSRRCPFAFHPVFTSSFTPSPPPLPPLVLSSLRPLSSRPAGPMVTCHPWFGLGRRWRRCSPRSVLPLKCSLMMIISGLMNLFVPLSCLKHFLMTQWRKSSLSPRS